MPETREPTKEETASLIRTIWAALIEPKWTYEELVTLGKMVYAKVPIARIDKDVMGILLPKLATIAQKIHVTAIQPLLGTHEKEPEKQPEVKA